MEEQIAKLKSIWNENEVIDDRVPILISTIYPKVHRGRTHREVSQLLGVPHSYIIKWGKYGLHRLVDSEKKAIRERDGNKCRSCNRSNVNDPTIKLYIHHIHSARNNRASNLLTVCNVCHQALHKLRDISKIAYQELIDEIKKMKDPKKVKAGKARWKGISKSKRKEITRQAGIKGGAETWRRIRAGKLSPSTSENVLDVSSV